MMTVLLVVALVVPVPVPLEQGVGFGSGGFAGAVVDPGWSWWARPGRAVEVELWHTSGTYPDGAGVVFFVTPFGGVEYRDRTDVRGPAVGDVFHASARDVARGDRYRAVWTARDGVQHVAVFTV